MPFLNLINENFTIILTYFCHVPGVLVCALYRKNISQRAPDFLLIIKTLGGSLQLPPLLPSILLNGDGLLLPSTRREKDQFVRENCTPQMYYL